MKIFFEEYPYQVEVAKKYLLDHYLVYLKDDRVTIPFVGYYYSKQNSDTVFILPKVFINVVDKEEKAFGMFNPETIVDTKDVDNPLMKSSYFNEVFNLSAWIYRAIARYKERHKPENITENVDVLNVQSIKGEKSETWIDIILNLIRFNNEHRQLFTYIARINSQGQNKIAWNKTINRIIPHLQDDAPVYMRFFNKKKTMNFDEELLVLFYSVLDFLHTEFNFKILRNVNYQTDAKGVRRLISSGKGTRLLRKIRHKYFKDELVQLWNLLYVFFEKAENIASKNTHQEALMVRNFNIVFEDMIDALISDDTKAKRKDLADQPDGKLVDHIYRYDSLISANDIYYIGDSKYYKDGHDPGTNSIFKQFTYAKNVIQLNMDLWHPKPDEIGRPNYFDPLTEGYNVSPNFFIRGVVKPDNINYNDIELNAETIETNGETQVKVEEKFHHLNRLFDRDTLFIQKYSINFLFVLAAYATNKTDKSFQKRIQGKFRENFIRWLNSRYMFYDLKFSTQEEMENFVNCNFRLLIGKLYHFNGSLILALEQKSSDKDSILNLVRQDCELMPFKLK